MEVHVLNGNALAEKFPFDDSLIVCCESIYGFGDAQVKHVLENLFTKPV